MKPVVPAYYAQFWVGAGGKRAGCACGLRAYSNGMVYPTLLPWRPVLVRGRTPIAVIPARVRNRLGTCNAVHRSLGAVTLCADVACLDVRRVDQGTTKGGPGQGGLLIAL